MLTKCSECGHLVSTTAESCPNCGSRFFLNDESKRRYINIDLSFSYPDDMLKNILDYDANPMRSHEVKQIKNREQFIGIDNPIYHKFSGGRIGIEINRKNVKLSNPLYIHGTSFKLPVDTPIPCFTLNYGDKFNPLQDWNGYPNIECPLKSEGWNPISQLSSSLSYIPSEDDPKDIILNFVVETTSEHNGDLENYVPLIFGEIRKETILSSTEKLSISIEAVKTGKYRTVKYFIPNGKLFRKRDVLEGQRNVPVYAYHIANIIQSK